MEKITEILTTICPEITVQDLTDIENGDVEKAKRINSLISTNISTRAEKEALKYALSLVSDVPDENTNEFEELKKKYTTNNRVDWAKIKKEYPSLKDATEAQKKQILESIGKEFGISNPKDITEIVNPMKSKIESLTNTAAANNEFVAEVKRLQEELEQFKANSTPNEEVSKSLSGVQEASYRRFLKQKCESFLENSNYSKEKGETDNAFTERKRKLIEGAVNQIFANKRVDANGDIIDSSNVILNNAIKTPESVLESEIPNLFSIYNIKRIVTHVAFGEKNNSKGTKVGDMPLQEQIDKIYEALPDNEKPKAAFLVGQKKEAIKRQLLAK